MYIWARGSFGAPGFFVRSIIGRVIIYNQAHLLYIRRPPIVNNEPPTVHNKAFYLLYIVEPPIVLMKLLIIYSEAS